MGNQPTNAYPSWYTPENQGAATPTTQPQAQPKIQRMGPNNQPLPGWYVSEADEAKLGGRATSTAPNATMPSWYTPDPQQSEQASLPQRSTDTQDMIANAATGLARVPGAILGAPHAILADFPAWVAAKARNALFGTHDTAASIEAQDPANQFAITSDKVDNAIFNAVGRKPYEPTSIGGRLGQAAVTGIGAGLVDPAADASLAGTGASLIRRLVAAVPNALKTGAAAASAEGTHELFPNSDVAPVLSALLTHSGINATTGTVGRVASEVGTQIFRPTRAGMKQAAATLENGVGNSPNAAMAQPTASDLNNAATDVRNATGAIPAGLSPWLAGAQTRDALQARVDDLKQARDRATAPLLAARDSSPAFVNSGPVEALISKKLGYAAGPQADALQGALSDLNLSSGEPRTTAAQMAAARTAINSRIGAATRAGDNASAAHLIDVRNALDAQITQAVPEAGQHTQTFANLSRPLDPMQYGPVGKVLDRDQFNSRFTLPDERIPDLFLRSTATRSDLGQLVDAFGGDRNAALAGLEQHLAGVAQNAINPDGTLDAARFARAMAPYQKSMGNLGVWFPGLAGKFRTAQAAQGTLDTMRAQSALADTVTSGGLRDTNDAVTGQSFGKWLTTNRDALAKAQSPAAVMRLQQIQKALSVPQGQLADAMKTEVLPAAAGFAFGGTEGGILGSMLHKTAGVAFNGLDARRQAAFNAAIERATLDPAYAAKLTAEMGKRGRYMSPARALVQSVYATAPATIAGRGVQRQAE